ncbi:response regulator transcription factor [Abyssisolibacter fermentans]|uniref:response regulator transcription factor n=1 Tax=Abyssisolibacter fermentans TaxID=1766203 RepID=UPI0008349670|nr:response regulator transcription factor [Abyssisolibacter fermentans]
MNNILLVEDDFNLSYGIEFALKNEGFNVTVMNNIEKARNVLASNDFDLILLDVMLPDGNGYELCQEIRNSSDVSIIFLTACDEEVNVVMGLDMGGDDYITKPFRIRELISRIKAVLRRNITNDSKKQVLVSGDIAINILEGKVKKNNEEILLTAQEYKLLHMLMENAKHVLSRKVLLEKLWDVESDFVDDNTLSVYIRRLREKIEDNPQTPKYIATVRGIGYRWELDLRR